jgi:hypothetical protein
VRYECAATSALQTTDLASGCCFGSMLRERESCCWERSLTVGPENGKREKDAASDVAQALRRPGTQVRPKCEAMCVVSNGQAAAAGVRANLGAAGRRVLCWLAGDRARPTAAAEDTNMDFGHFCIQDEALPCLPV